MSDRPDKVYAWFDHRGRLVQLTETRSVNPAPQAPGYTEITDDPMVDEVRRFPDWYYRDSKNRFKKRKPVQIRLSKRAITANGSDSLVVQVVGAGRKVRVRVDGEEAEVDAEGLTVSSNRPGILRVDLHEDEVDLLVEDRAGTFAVARSPAQRPE